MFRRAPAYHPYKPSAPLSPAGFRLGDYVPRRCFNLFQGPDFTNKRLPDPSPLSSPIRAAREDDPPPTIRLADLFVGDSPGFPKRPTTSTPDHRQNPEQNAVPTADERLPIPPRRKTKRGPKYLSFKKDAHRPRVSPPHHRPQQLKDKRNASRKRFLDRHERHMTQASDTIRRLRKEAEELMTPGHMNDEDQVFLEQLKNLHLDQKLTHDLERWRQRMARAAEETEERRKEHETRDKEAEKACGEKQNEEVEEEWKRKVEEFVCGKDEGREARRRRVEEEAMHADQERQRAHEAMERKIREDQERIFREELARKAKEEERQGREKEERRLQEQKEQREREERERRLQEVKRKLWEEVERARQAERERRQREEEEHKLREEVERLLREAHERFLREERERLARLRAEQAHRVAQEDQVHRHFIMYEGKWNELRTNSSLPPIDVREMPWPVFGVISSADQITYQDVRAFLFHPQRPGVEGKTARDKVKSEVLRFHPDKFNTRIVPKVQSSQHVVAQEIAGAVARILTTIMTEEVEQ